MIEFDRPEAKLLRYLWSCSEVLGVRLDCRGSNPTICFFVLSTQFPSVRMMNWRMGILPILVRNALNFFYAYVFFF